MKLDAFKAAYAEPLQPVVVQAPELARQSRKDHRNRGRYSSSVIIRRPLLFAFVACGATVGVLLLGYVAVFVWLAFHPIPFD